MLFHSSGVSFMVVILYYGHWLTWLALFSILDASCVTNVSSLPSPRREALQQVSTLPIILVSITTPPVYLLWPMRCLPATESCLFIAEDSRCQVFIAENKMQLDKILKVWYIHCLVSKHSIFTPLFWFCGSFLFWNDLSPHHLIYCDSSLLSCSLSLLQVKDRLPNLKAIVQYLPGEVDEEQRAQGVMSWQEFYDYGRVSYTPLTYYVYIELNCQSFLTCL